MIRRGEVGGLRDVPTEASSSSESGGESAPLGASILMFVSDTSNSDEGGWVFGCLASSDELGS